MSTLQNITLLIACLLMSTGFFVVVCQVWKTLRIFFRIRKLRKIRRIVFTGKGGPIDIGAMAPGKLEPFSSKGSFRIPDPGDPDRPIRLNEPDYEIELDESTDDKLASLEDGDIMKINGRDIEIIKNPDRFFDVDRFIKDSYPDFELYKRIQKRIHKPNGNTDKGEF